MRVKEKKSLWGKKSITKQYREGFLEGLNQADLIASWLMGVDEKTAKNQVARIRSLLMQVPLSEKEEVVVYTLSQQTNDSDPEVSLFVTTSPELLKDYVRKRVKVSSNPREILLVRSNKDNDTFNEDPLAVYDGRNGNLLGANQKSEWKINLPYVKKRDSVKKL